MRPEPKEPGLGCAGVLLIATICTIMYFTEDKPHKDYIKEQTKPILNQAHKEAVNSVDTLDLTKYFIDVKTARKDSARLAKEMQNFMQDCENPRYCDYKYVYDTIYRTGHGNTDTLYRLQKHMWHFDIEKAQQYPKFANTYKQYVNAIKQLEIARRQGKRK